MATGQCWLAIALLRPTTSGTLARCFRSVSPVWRMRLLSVRFILVSCSALPASHAAELHLDVWHHLQEEQCIAPGTTFFTGANACVEGCLRVLATICRRLSFQGSNKIMARDCSEVHSCSRFQPPIPRSGSLYTTFFSIIRTNIITISTIDRIFWGSPALHSCKAFRQSPS